MEERLAERKYGSKFNGGKISGENMLCKVNGAKIDM